MAQKADAPGERVDIVITAQPVVVWFDQPEVVKAVTGKSLHQLKRWARDGLAIHSKQFPSGKTRRYIVVSEYLAFLRATSTSNQDSD